MARPWSSWRVVLLVRGWYGLTWLLWFGRFSEELKRSRCSLVIVVSILMWSCDVMGSCMEWVMVGSLVVMLSHVIL